MGKVHWDNKIEASVKSEVLVDSTEVEAQAEDVEGEGESVNKEKIMGYTNNLPEEAISKIEAALKTEEPVHLVIFGSASSPESGGWPTLLKQKISDTYGDDLIKVTIKEMVDTTTEQIVEEELYTEVINTNPDILLFEPFILYDNGKVRIEDRLENIEFILEEFNKENPDLLVLLQPANPLYNAVYYPLEVLELERFAEDNSYIYLNHWKAWPDQDSTEMEDYLVDLFPNENGHEVWAQYLIDYFISNNDTNE